MPRITIVSPSLQQARFLGECLRSVHDQGYPDLEHIVVDGGSDDGSREILEQHSDQLDWWCSEKDGGQSHAINKASAHASGSIISWLNSDDLLLPGALMIVADAFQADPEAVVVSGTRIRRTPDGKEEAMPPDDPMDREAWLTHPMVHQSSTFVRRDAFMEIGGVDEALHFAMDYELWLQLLFRFGAERVRILKNPLSVFRLHAESKTMRGQELIVTEVAAVLHDLCVRTGSLDLASILALGYGERNDLRGIPIGDGNKGLVRRMVIHFLLKWNRVIFHRRQFDMMKRLASEGLMRTASLGSDQRVAWNAIESQLGRGGWLAFRARRKWDHWKR